MICRRLTVVSLLLFLMPAAGCGPVDKALGRLTLTLSSESMEPTIKKGARVSVSDRWFDVKVRQDRIWIMSDNRRVSLDSRAQRDKVGGGTIGRKDVIAVVEDWKQP